MKGRCQPDGFREVRLDEVDVSARVEEEPVRPVTVYIDTIQDRMAIANLRSYFTRQMTCGYNE